MHANVMDFERKSFNSAVMGPQIIYLLGVDILNCDDDFLP